MFYRGEDFRPAYKEVLCLRSIIEAPVLAITGTCNEKVKKNIFSYLALTDEVSVAVVPDRYVFYFIYLNICMILIVVWSINNQFSLYYVQEKLFYRVYQKLVHFQAKYYLDIRESKQNHETDLQWMVDYLSAEKTNAKKIIV